ncbi:MAG: hypothetical protein CMF26_05105 [Kiloniella sp.]|nr:hypothetical protein [Kiloniella sp.]
MSSSSYRLPWPWLRSEIVRCAVILLLLWTPALAGPARGQAGSVSYPDLSQLQPDTVVAVVNGNPINFATIVYAHQQLPGSYRDLPLEQIMPQVMQLVIEQRLLAEEAARNGMQQSVRYQAALQFEADRLLQEMYIATAVTDQLDDEALEIAYSVYVTQLPTEDRARARQILISPANNDETEVRRALMQAQQVIGELQAGADFALLARQLSDHGPIAAQGGDLGYFGKGQSSFGERFDAAVFAMFAGTRTPEPITTRYGFHVVEVIDRQQMKPPLDDIRGSLRAQLENQKIAMTLDELRNNAEIDTIIEIDPGMSGN